MFKSLRWLIKFRKNFQNLKKHYQIIIYATKKDFAYYQKKQSLSDYQIEEVLFYIARMQDYHQKISSMSLLQAGITKNRDFQTYIGLFKKNMFKCNEILMIGARYELLRFQQDIDFLINDKSHDLFKHLSPDIQTAFINIYKLTHNTIKSIDENNLRNFAQYKYKLDIFLEKLNKRLSPQKYNTLFDEINKLQQKS